MLEVLCCWFIGVVIAPKVKLKEERRSSIQVIARAAAVLRALEQSGERMSLGQLAQATQLPRSTVQRIVSALAAEQLLDVDIAGRGIALGAALGRLASAARIDVRQMLRPYLERVVTVVNETVDLSLLQEDQVVFIDQILSTERLRVVSAVGSSFPVTTTAPGKILLALLTPAEREQWVRSSKEGRALKASGRSGAFLLEVEKAASEGFAYDLDEHSVGISAIAVSVLLPNAPAHSISIPAPSARFAERLPLLKESLLRLQEGLGKRVSQHGSPVRD